jgi:hypothetical protein
VLVEARAIGILPDHASVAPLARAPEADEQHLPDLLADLP